jgi:hypothetical protein
MLLLLLLHFELKLKISGTRAMSDLGLGSGPCPALVTGTVLRLQVRVCHSGWHCRQGRLGSA